MAEKQINTIWSLILILIIGLFLVFVTSAINTFNSNDVLEPTSGLDYDIESISSPGGIQTVRESASSSDEDLLTVMGQALGIQPTKVRLTCYGSIHLNNDGTYSGSCSGDCVKTDSFSISRWSEDENWFCTNCGGLPGSPFCNK